MRFSDKLNIVLSQLFKEAKLDDMLDNDNPVFYRVLVSSRGDIGLDTYCRDLDDVMKVLLSLDDDRLAKDGDFGSITTYYSIGIGQDREFVNPRNNKTPDWLRAGLPIEYYTFKVHSDHIGITHQLDMDGIIDREEDLNRYNLSSYFEPPESDLLEFTGVKGSRKIRKINNLGPSSDTLEKFDSFDLRG